MIKIGPSPSKKTCVTYLIENPLKNNEKCFLFHLKSSVRPQDI